VKTKRHKLIVIEGISGSGKTEISKRLAKALKARYYITPAGMFRKHRPTADKTLSLEARFLYYLSSVVQASWEITKLLEKKDVICDKYIWSTICYHTVFGLKVHMPKHLKIRKPDHTFLIVCDDDKRVSRLRKRGPIKDMDQFNVRQEMERRCLVEFRKHLDTVIENCTEDPDEPVQKILGIIQGGQT
jgi:dTMP kinase